MRSSFPFRDFLTGKAKAFVQEEAALLKPQMSPVRGFESGWDAEIREYVIPGVGTFFWLARLASGKSMEVAQPRHIFIDRAIGKAHNPSSSKLRSWSGGQWLWSGSLKYRQQTQLAKWWGNVVWGINTRSLSRAIQLWHGSSLSAQTAYIEYFIWFNLQQLKWTDFLGTTQWQSFQYQTSRQGEVSNIIEKLKRGGEDIYRFTSVFFLSAGIAQRLFRVALSWWFISSLRFFDLLAKTRVHNTLTVIASRARPCRGLTMKASWKRVERVCLSAKLDHVDEFSISSEIYFISD